MCPDLMAMIKYCKRLILIILTKVLQVEHENKIKLIERVNEAAAEYFSTLTVNCVINCRRKEEVRRSTKDPIP